MRIRTYKWVRRAYAQANLAPLIVGIDDLEPPVRNVFSISGAAQARILEPAAGGSTLKLKVSGISDAFELPIEKNANFDTVKDAVVEWLTAPEQNLRVDVVPVNFSELTSKGGHPSQPSFDLYLYDQSGDPRTFNSVDCADSEVRAAFEIPVLTLDNEDNLVGGSPSQRIWLRKADSAHDSQIDVYVVPKAAIAGRAYPVYRETNYADHPELRPDVKLRRAAWVAYEAQNYADGPVFGEDWWISPFTLAHEIEHVLADAGHNEAEGDLMKGSWSKINSVTAEKRIYSAPILVSSPNMNLDKAEGEDEFRGGQDMRADLHDRRAGFGVTGVDGEVLQEW